MKLSHSRVGRKASATKRFQPAIRHILPILAIAVMLFGNGNHLNAQTPLARFVAPTNTTSTAVQPTFEIITSLPIDTTSVHWKRQYVDSNKINFPTFCLMQKAVFDAATSDTDLGLAALIDTGVIVNDTTIEFTPMYALQNGTTYEGAIIGLRLVSGSDTITVPDTAARISFTTVILPPHVTSISCMSSGYVLTQDTITAFFSAKLDSVNGGGGPIISLAASIVRYDSGSDSMLVYDSAVSTAEWLDGSDSTQMHILPNGGMVPGQGYSVAVKMSNLTGDTAQDFKARFQCRRSFILNVVAAPTNGLSCLGPVQFDPSINDNYQVHYDSSFDSSTRTETYDTTVSYDSSAIGRVVNAGDTVEYTAPTQVGGAIFKQWSGSGNIAIDTSTNPTVRVTETADQLHDMNIIALYCPVQVDTVSVAISDSSNPTHNQDFVEVRSDSQDCPLSTLLDTITSQSSVNNLLERGKVITLHAYSLSGSTFDHWTSTDTNINGQTNPVISFTTTGGMSGTNTGVSGTFETGGGPQPPRPADFQLCAHVSVAGTPGDAKATTAWTFPTPCQNNTSCSPLSATLHIYDKSYGLDSYTIDGGNCAPIHVFHDMQDKHTVCFTFWGKRWCFTYETPKDLYANNGNGTFTPPEATQIDSPTTQVHFIVQKMYEKLTIYLKMDGDNAPNGTGLTFDNSNASKVIDWCYDNAKPVRWDHSTAVEYGEYWDIYTLYYLYGTNVSLTCGADSGYKFLRWDTLPPNTNWPEPVTSSSQSFTMDQDRIVTGLFSVPFILENISFYQWVGRAPGINPVTDQDPWGGDPNGGPVYQTFNVDDWDNNAEKLPQLTGGQTYPSSARAWGYGLWAGSSSTWWGKTPYVQDGGSFVVPEGPHIVLHFNKPIQAYVNPPNSAKNPLAITISEKSPSYYRGNRMPISDLKPIVGATFDLPWQNAKVTSNDVEISLTFPTTDPYGLDEDFKIGSASGCECPIPGLAIWKGQQITVNVTDGIKSMTNDVLSNPQNFTLHTEDPDITWTYVNSHLGDSPLDCPCDYWAWTQVLGASWRGKTETSADNWYYAESCIDQDGEQNEDMNFSLPKTNPINQPCGFGSGDNGGDASCSGSSEQTIFSAPHCWYQRQFELGANVYAGIPDCFPWHISSSDGDVNGDWSCNFGNFQTQSYKTDVIRNNDRSSGDFSPYLRSSNYENDDEDGDLDGDVYDNDFGVSQFSLTSLDHWIDWWGAAAYTYGNAHSDNGTAYHQWSDNGFRADIRVDIK